MKTRLSISARTMAAAALINDIRASYEQRHFSFVSLRPMRRAEIREKIAALRELRELACVIFP
jgi:hypothetical protein